MENKTDYAKSTNPISDARMTNMLKEFVASDGNTLEGCEPSQLGSAEIKSYFDNNSVLLRLYLSTAGKAGNNKPYTLNRRVSMEQAKMVIDKLADMRKAADDFFADGVGEQL